MSDEPGVTPEEMQTVIATAVGLNSISLICTFAVLMVYTFLRTTRPSLVNRTSLRLAVATAIADLLYSIAQIISDVISQDGTLCALSVWWYIQFTLLSVFLTAAVAINLQVVFLHGRHDARFLEKWYYILALLLATVISGAGYFGDQYGWSEMEHNCWFNKDGELHSVLWQWGTIYVWLLLVILYCSVVIGMVLYRINREADNLDLATAMSGGSRSQVSSIMSPPASPTLPPSPSSPSRESTLMTPNMSRHLLKKRKRKNLARILRRIILYPAIPIITQTPNLLVTMEAYLLGYNSYGLVMASFIATSIQGMLNCVIFFIDPAVKSGLADYRQERRERQLKMDALPTMVVTNADKIEKAPLVAPPSKVHQGSYAKKWRKKIEGEQVVPPSPSDTVFGESSGQDFLGVKIETGTWKFAQDDEEEWFKLL